MEKVVISIPWTECPHCHKIVGVAVLRTMPVKDLLLVDSSMAECPRSECGRLLGFVSVTNDAV